MDGIFYMGDTRESIRRVQGWLREISRRDDRITPVFIDGIYGDETRRAVSDIQNAYGVSATGELDKATFDLIFSVYTDIITSAEALGLHPKFEKYEGGVMSPGDEFDDVYALQLLLRELSLKDDRFFVEASGRFDPQTEIAVKLLQKTLSAAETGRVDIPLWNSLVKLARQTEGFL